MKECLKERFRKAAASVSLVVFFLLGASLVSGFSVGLPETLRPLLPPGSVLSPGPWRYDEAAGRALVGNEHKTFLSLSSYHCLVRTFYHEEKEHGRLKADEKMILSVRSSGDIRVDLLRPRKGAWLIYRKDMNQVRVKPFSFLPMTLALAPDSSLITSRFGHTINHADYGSFYSRVLAPSCLLEGCVYLDRGVVLGHNVRIINVAPVFGIARPIFGRMWISLDGKTNLPVSISTMDSQGRFMERITYAHCQWNPQFPKNFFRE
jgi:hypothetical protein